VLELAANRFMLSRKKHFLDCAAGSLCACSGLWEHVCRQRLHQPRRPTLKTYGERTSDRRSERLPPCAGVHHRHAGLVYPAPWLSRQLRCRVFGRLRAAGAPRRRVAAAWGFHRRTCCSILANSSFDLPTQPRTVPWSPGHSLLTAALFCPAPFCRPSNRWRVSPNSGRS